MALAKQKILTFLDELQKESNVVKVSIPQAAFPFIVGPRGSVVQGIQQSCNARIDLDRKELVAVIKGRCEKLNYFRNEGRDKQ